MGLDFFGGILSAYGGFLINIGNYLSGTQPNAPETTGYQTPYTPPFSGGQCANVRYQPSFTYSQPGIRPNTGSYGSGDGSFYGKIQAIESVPNTGNIRIIHRDGTTQFTPAGMFSGNGAEYTIALTNIVLTPLDGATDNCGNLPNPNPSVLNPDGGSIDSAYPTVEPTEIVPAALPILAPGTVAALLAALGNAANLAAIAANLADLLDYILKWIDEREKNDPKKKNLVTRNLGAIEKDGFLRLYPFDRNGSQAINLDMRFYQIPIWKKDTLLGSKSPNRYRELGRILFVSETLGIIEEIDISYTLNSIPIPESAIGFYYHLGLEGTAKAYTTVFYLE